MQVKKGVTPPWERLWQKMHISGQYYKRKNRRQAVLCLLLAVLTILSACLVACKDAPPPVVGLRFLSSDNVSIYSVVYPGKECPEQVRLAAENIRDAMQTVLGTEVRLKADDDENDHDDPTLSYEILVGETNRQESTDALKDMGAEGYTVRVAGKKIVVTGKSNRAIGEAAEHFMTDVLKYEGSSTPVNASLTIDKEYCYDAEYEIPKIMNSVDTLVTCAAYQATTLYRVAVPADQSDALTLATLQGLMANCSSEQILLTAGAYEEYLPYLTSGQVTGREVTVTDKNDDGKTWTLELLLQYFAPKVKGYLLCDADFSKESPSVAVSLAHQWNAVVVTTGNEQRAKDAGLTCVLDVTGKDDQWLRNSPYFDQLNREIAVEQPIGMSPKLVDYAVMSGSYFYFYDGGDLYTHAQKFKFLDEGGVVIGWNNTLGEYSTVRSLSSINLQLIPADHAYNLSTLSGFSMLSARVENESGSSGEADGVHTVCLVMSDGDNLQWALNDYVASNRWYGSSYRGDFAMNWGLPATMIDLASPMLSRFYQTKTAEDEFLLQLSGLGYTFPSLWNAVERRDMAGKVADAMKRMNMKYLEVLDDHGFRAEVLSDFTAQDQIEGVLYIDYSDYAGEKGKILWSDDKPIVSARYRLWAGVADGSIETVAAQLNQASRDVSSEDAYSFVIVHAWSGLDQNGRFVGGGDTMAAVNDLIDRLETDVEVVTVSEFMARIKKNLRG